MSASTSKKQRKAEAALGLSEKEIQAQAAAAKTKQKTIIYSVIGVIVAICVALLLIWDSGVIQKNSTALTVGDQKYGIVDVEYYYYSTLNSYSSYASLYGLDTSAPLDEQEIYEGYTWDQMLKDSAIDTLTSVAMLTSEAEKAGYTLSQDGENSVTQALLNMEAYATLYGVSHEYYLQASYGEYMTEKELERILTDLQLATEYSEVVMESMEPTEEAILNFYKENSAELDTIDYNCYLVPFDTTTKDADGHSVALDADTIAANQAKAKGQAQEILDALVAGDVAKAAKLAEDYGATDNSNMSGISYSGYADWMADQSHGAGSYALVENISASDEETVIGYFAIYVNSREREEYCGANVRVLPITASADEDGKYDMDECKKRADQILANFEATDKSSEGFATVYANAGGSASYPGGLYEDLSKKAFSEEITNWIFDTKRTQGDYTLIKDAENNRYCLVYFEGISDIPYWRAVSISNVQAEMYTEWETANLENFVATEASGMKYVG